MIYLSEETGFIPWYLKEYFSVIFKCYLPPLEDNKIKFLPLCPLDDVPVLNIKPMEKRTLAMSFIGNLNYRRLTFYEVISGKNLPRPVSMKRFSSYRKYLKKEFNTDTTHIHFTNGFRKGLKGNEYASLLNNSKIALCPEGFLSNETYRIYEALRAGCVVIAPRLPDYSFYMNSPIIQINSWNELTTVKEQLLNDTGRLKELQKEGISWYEDHFSPKAIASYIAKNLDHG